MKESWMDVYIYRAVDNWLQDRNNVSGLFGRPSIYNLQKPFKSFSLDLDWIPNYEVSSYFRYFRRNDKEYSWSKSNGYKPVKGVVDTARYLVDASSIKLPYLWLMVVIKEYKTYTIDYKNIHNEQLFNCIITRLERYSKIRLAGKHTMPFKPYNYDEVGKFIQNVSYKPSEIYGMTYSLLNICRDLAIDIGSASVILDFRYGRRS